MPDLPSSDLGKFDYSHPLSVHSALVSGSNLRYCFNCAGENILPNIHCTDIRACRRPTWAVDLAGWGFTDCGFGKSQNQELGPDQKREHLYAFWKAKVLTNFLYTNLEQSNKFTLLLEWSEWYNLVETV